MVNKLNKPSTKENISKAILELCAEGNQGNLHDFMNWLQYVYQIESDDQQLDSIFSLLVKEGQLKIHNEFNTEYLQNTLPDFKESVEYNISSSLSYSPIQFVRSRLEAFLKNKKANNTEIIDISIAITEAMENAVKYSSDKAIQIHYTLHNNLFEIKIINEIKNIIPEEDIRSGKYTGTMTLMRGMMVMVKLLDKVDIDIGDDQNIAIFSGKHTLKR